MISDEIGNTADELDKHLFIYDDTYVGNNDDIDIKKNYLQWDRSSDNTNDRIAMVMHTDYYDYDEIMTVMIMAKTIPIWDIHINND